MQEFIHVAQNCFVDREFVLHVPKNQKCLSNIPDNFYLEFEILLRIRDIVECQISCSVTPSNIWCTGSPRAYVFISFLLPLLRAAHVIGAQSQCIGSLRTNSL